MKGPFAFLFAHGAGAGSRSPWMKAWAEKLRELGPVRVFDFPYMKAGRKAPDRLPKLIDAHRAELIAWRKKHPRKKIVLVGKSMGSRVGCHLSLEEEVAAVVCLGYPLRSPKGELRDAVLKAMKTPVFFAQGERDPLAPIQTMRRVAKKLKAPTRLERVPSGNHSLELTKTFQRESGISQEASDAGLLEAIGRFLERI